MFIFKCSYLNVHIFKLSYCNQCSNVHLLQAAIFVEQIFHRFDTDRNGTIDFKVRLCASVESLCLCLVESLCLCLVESLCLCLVESLRIFKGVHAGNKPL